MNTRHDTAVIAHVFYPELWQEIRSCLVHLGPAFDLFVTIPSDADIAESIVTAAFPQARVSRCENRGRDVAPFLRTLSSLSHLDYKYVCKIHTKKSPQLADGQRWRLDMVSKLLGSPAIVARIKRAFDRHPDWGLIAPRGHVVPHVYYWKRNARRVVALAQAAGIPTDTIDFSFVAGSMFWFRPRAFDLLMTSGVLTAPFEAEYGQQDGTTAHAFERLFGMAANHAGYQIAESDSSSVRPSETSYHFMVLARTWDRHLSPMDTSRPEQGNNAEGETSIQALRGAYPGGTAWIVGTGPSLVMLSKEHIGEGPVIAINEAIIAVEALRLASPVYSMQKDADEYDTAPGSVASRVPRLDGARPIAPVQGAVLLVDRHESPARMEEYRPRYVFDNIVDFGLEWWDFSSLVAVAIARLMGCTRVVFVCLDASAHGDARSCRPRANGTFEILASDDAAGAQYPEHRRRIDEYLAKVAMPAEYLTPEPSPGRRRDHRVLIGALNHDIERLEAEAALRDRERERLLGITEASQQDVQRLRVELDDSRREAQTLTAVAGDRASEIEHLTGALGESKNEVQRVGAELAQAHAEVSRLLAAADEQAREAERLTVELSDARTHASSVRAELEAAARRAEAAVERLHTLTGELVAARHDVEALLSSASWRWMAPLRAAKRILMPSRR